MRHRNRGRKLGRNSQERRALLRSLARALILSPAGRIVTTPAKAKEAAPFVHRLVTLARRGGLPERRRALSLLPDKPAVRKLFAEIAPQMASRDGGYTRILRLGGEKGRYRAWSVGNAADRVLLEFVGLAAPVEAPAAETVSRKKGLLGRIRDRLPGQEKKQAKPTAGS